MSDTNPVPPPAAIGAPGSIIEKVKRERKPLEAYTGGERDGDGKLIAPPTDYNHKKHARMTKKDFAKEDIYMDFCALQFENKAKRLREQAEKIRTLGTGASAQKLKTVLKLQEKLAELMATLAAEGISLPAAQ